MTNILFIVGATIVGQATMDDTFSSDVRGRLIEATVRIVQQSSTCDTVGTGIAVAVRGSCDDLFILTAYHVVEGSGRIEIQTFSLHEFPNPVKHFKTGVRVVATDERADLALLHVSTNNCFEAALPLCPLGSLPKRFPALACGCSLTEPPLLWSAPVESALVLRGNGIMAKFWVTAEREPLEGESGGAMVDRFGRVIGICSMGSKKRGIYCHLQELHDFLAQNGFATADCDTP